MMIRSLAEQLFDRGGDALIVVDDARIIDGNPAALRLFGLATHADLLATDPAALGLPTLGQPPPLWREALDKAAAGEPALVTWQPCRLDGQRFTAEARPMKLQLADRPALGLAIRDIGHRVLERQQDSRFAEIVVEAALDCVIGMDAAGHVVAFNPAAERTFGYSRGEALGRPVAELIVPPELREHHRTAVERHQQTGAARILGQRSQMPAQRADGSRFTVELIVVEGFGERACPLCRRSSRPHRAAQRRRSAACQRGLFPQHRR